MAGSSTISTDSFVHRIELSKLLLSTIRLAALARLAVASTSTGTLPGPTPMAGVPELYAARTTGTPPVATITDVRSSVISALISGTLGSSTTWITPSGAPAATAAAAIVRAASAQHSLASGCGLSTTTLRVMSVSRHLKNTVATGLVDGVS